MTNSDKTNEPGKKAVSATKKESRQQREAKALRDNLKRRKEQQKARDNALKKD